MSRIGPDAVELGKQIGILTTEANRTRRDYRHALEHIKFLASEYIDDDFNWRIINEADGSRSSARRAAQSRASFARRRRGTQRRTRTGQG
jgi:hypothetical protein